MRAALLAPEQPLAAYSWSSYPLYLRPVRRPSWLRIDRLLGEHGIQSDDAKGRTAFQKAMEERRRENTPSDAWAELRRGWKLGAADFVQRLAERLGRAGKKHELARERDQTDEQRAERLVRDSLQSLGWSEAELAARAKADARKVALALRLRRHTPMTREWIAQRLHIGSASYVSQLTAKAKHCRL